MNAPEKKKHILVIHGPNLNLLGLREPEVYGHTTLETINSTLVEQGGNKDVSIETFQSNHEGAIVDKIQSSAPAIDGLIINPAAFTHTSVAIRDALLMLSVPIIEVHLSNIHKREKFRHHSYMSDITTGQIVGLGADGYYLALRAMVNLI